MAAVELVHTDGRRATVTTKRAVSLLGDPDSGWREWTDDDKRAAEVARRELRNPPPVPESTDEPEPRRRRTTPAPADEVSDLEPTPGLTAENTDQEV